MRFRISEFGFEIGRLAVCLLALVFALTGCGPAPVAPGALPTTAPPPTFAPSPSAFPSPTGSVATATIPPAPSATPLATPSPTSRPTVAGTAGASPTPTAVSGLGAQPTASIAQGAEKMIDLAKSDLAKRNGVAVSEITVVSSEAKDWSDSSLGCPQPGMMYAQVITPGYLIILSQGGQTYEYHTDRGQRVVLCQKR